MDLFCVCCHLYMYKQIIYCDLSFCNWHQTHVTFDPWLHFITDMIAIKLSAGVLKHGKE